MRSGGREGVPARGRLPRHPHATLVDENATYLQRQLTSDMGLKYIGGAYFVLIEVHWRRDWRWKRGYLIDKSTECGISDANLVPSIR